MKVSPPPHSPGYDCHCLRLYFALLMYRQDHVGDWAHNTNQLTNYVKYILFLLTVISDCDIYFKKKMVDLFPFWPKICVSISVDTLS